MDIIRKGMKDIAIFGAGGFGREVACLINLINKENPTWNMIGFFDDDPELKGKYNEFGKILGGIETLNAYESELSLAMCIGSPHIVRKIVEKINNPKVDFPNLFAPNTIFLNKDSVKFGKGNIICLSCIFSCNIEIGDFNTFNGLITVGHDVKIGSYNSMMPSVRISGEVSIGDENFFGCSSFLLQQITIGNKTVIGANSAVLRKTKDGFTYIGNPAIKVKL